MRLILLVLWTLLVLPSRLPAASRGELAVMDHELRALTEMALAGGDFSEIYHPETGKPFGGYQTGRLWESMPAQTWAAAAYIAMVYQGVFGMRFTPDGIVLQPLVPKRMEELSLKAFRYREMRLEITLKGAWNGVKQFLLDGKQKERPYIPAPLKGDHSVVVVVGKTGEG